MVKADKRAKVNLSLFETSGGTLKEPLQERMIAFEHSPSAEAAFLRTAAAEGGHSGNSDIKGLRAVDDPRESLGGKGGAAFNPGKEFSISSLLEKKFLSLNPGIEREKGKRISAPRSNRDDLLNYFHGRLSVGWPGKEPLDKRRFGIKVCFLKTQDLFYLKSICEDAERRGKIFSQVFWGSIKAQPPEYPQGSGAYPIT